MRTSCKYGTHRVIEPKGALPQSADKIDATPTITDNELLIDVDVLNIDSASFHQIKNACHGDIESMKTMIYSIVSSQGKMQNPITKSGGMLIGRVRAVGKNYHNQSLQKGTRMATLVSLSLTPLHIDTIESINITNEQVRIKGQAILFDSGIYSVLPDDLDDMVALAALDVAGAPAQAMKLAQKGDTAFIIGAAGKSGLLCAAALRKVIGKEGRIIGLVNEVEQKTFLSSINFYDEVLLEDATDAVAVYQKVESLTYGALADLTINCVNVGNTEMASILPTKNHGTVYFFSMATSFTKAALGAEGVGKDITMIIGNGYTENHANIALDFVRNDKTLASIFASRYA